MRSARSAIGVTKCSLCFSIYNGIYNGLKGCSYMMLLYMNYWQITLKHNKEWNPAWVSYIDCITDLLTAKWKATMLGNCFETDSNGKIHFHCIVTAKFINFNNWQTKWLNRGMYVYIQVVDPKKGLGRVQQYQSKEHLTIGECDEIWHTREIEEGYSFI